MKLLIHRTSYHARSIAPAVIHGFSPYLAQAITRMRGCVARNDCPVRSKTYVALDWLLSHLAQMIANMICYVCNDFCYRSVIFHYSYVIVGGTASQIIRLAIVYSTVYSGTDRRKHQSSASLVFVRGIHRWPVNFPHKRPLTRKMFPFDDVIMQNVCVLEAMPVNIESVNANAAAYCSCVTLPTKSE